MFFILSKTIAYFILPLSILILLLTYLCIFRRDMIYRKLCVFVLILLLFFSNNFIINSLLEVWEIGPKPIDQLGNTYQVGIVLGGFSKSQGKSTDRIYYTEAADRLIHAVLLYKRGKIKKILISGQFQTFTANSSNGIKQLKEISEVFSVPLADLLLDTQSRNTHENAECCERILASKGFYEKHLLITSAFHMRRAKACFKKTAIKFDDFSTHFLSRDITPMDMIMPDVDAILKWHFLAREVVGLLVYKFLNYA